MVFDIILPHLSSFWQYRQLLALYATSCYILDESLFVVSGVSFALTRMSLWFFGLRYPIFTDMSWRSRVLKARSSKFQVFSTCFDRPLYTEWLCTVRIMLAHNYVSRLTRRISTQTPMISLYKQFNLFALSST